MTSVLKKNIRKKKIVIIFAALFLVGMIIAYEFFNLHAGE